MIALRGLAFLFFLLLAAAMVVWQLRHLAADIAGAWSQTGVLVLMALGALVLALEGAALRGKRNRSLTGLALLSFPALPLVAVFAGFISLLQLRTGSHEQIWRNALTIGALVTANLLLPIVAGTLFIGGTPGLLSGWTAVKFQFFVVVDYFLIRSILHYFNSGASTFVSLRFLRKRAMSLLAVFGISLGVWVLIVVNSVMSGFQTDFREHMRGSLSHVLVRFRSEDIHGRMDARLMAEAQWAEFVRRIEARDDMLLPWEKALSDAVELYRATDKDKLPDPADWLHAQPPLPPDDTPEDPQPETPGPRGLDDDERDFIERLRTGKGLSDFDRECLRDEGRIVTPREFYLSRIGNADDEDEAARRAWYAPMFRQALQTEFDKAEEALMTHTNPSGERDVVGVSWRVSTKTFVTPKSGSRELPIAELIGVDAAREPGISQLGNYVANAELTSFRDQYALGPLLNLLGATLGWETEESLKATDATRIFMFTEDGKGMAAERLPSDMTDMLAMRRFTTATGRVRWRDFDNVRFAEFSPGRRIYERVRDAYKQAARTEDLARLGAILKSCEADVRAILLEHLQDESPTERWQQSNHTGALIIFNEYLTGLSDSVRTIRWFYEDVNQDLKKFVQDAKAADAPADEIALVNEVWAGLKRVCEAAELEAKGRDVPELEREAIILSMGKDCVAVMDEGLRKAELQRYPDAIDLFKNLRAYASRPQDRLSLRMRLADRRKVPLAYAVANYEAEAALINNRMIAYRQVLPLRTGMRLGESVDDYLRRATTPGLRPDERPGIILGDALAENALGRPVNIGDQIAVTIPRIYYENNRLVPSTVEVWFTVTGFFRSGLFEENRGRMYCDFEELSALLSDSEVRYVLGARLKDYSPYEGQLESDKLKADLRDALRRNRVSFISVGVWEDETRTLLDAVNIERTLIGLIVSFIIVLAGGAIVIIVYQLVNEKVRDIGILKALGHSPWGIRSVFMFNALFIGLFGAVLGSGVGMLASEYLNEIEDFIDGLTGIRLFPPDVYFLTYIPSVKGMDLLWLAIDIAAPVVMFGFFCGILPSLAAARKDPVEALHYE